MDRTASAEHQPRHCFVRACTAEMSWSELNSGSSAQSFDFWMRSTGSTSSPFAAGTTGVKVRQPGFSRNVAAFTVCGLWVTYGPMLTFSTLLACHAGGSCQHLGP